MNFKFNAASFPDRGKAVRGLDRSPYRISVAVSMICFHVLAVIQPYAATVSWTAGSGANFNWADGANWDLGIPSGTDEVLFRAPVPNPGSLLTNPSVISLASGSFIANNLSFLDNYSLSGGGLQLTTGGIRVGLGYGVNLSSLIDGNSGLTLTGGGTVRLSNAANSYSGSTTISNGILIITDPSQLGSDSSEIVVSLNNPVAGSVSTRGYGGGTLMLDGAGGDITLTRDLSLQGQGPIGDRGAAVISFGNNTLSGAINAAVPNTGTVGINTRLTSANGTLTLSGSLNVNGTAGTTVTSLGGTNTAGANFYNLTGVLSGTGTLEKTGAGTLFLNPSSTANFNGILRIGGSMATGQSSVRISSAGVLGNRTTAGTSGVLDFSGGVLEVRMDAPVVTVNNGSAANVYFRANSTVFVDHAIGGDAVNGTAVFGSGSFEDNITVTLNTRNGYGITFGAMAVNGGDNPSTFTNNAAGLVTYGGNFWTNANNTANRTLTMGGNGNSLITGSIVASAAAFDHSLVKSGSGLLTILGTASTLDGTVSVSGGVLAITDFRSITNNTGTINIGSGGTAGALFIGTSVAPTAGGLITSKTVNLASTTGAVSIYANQTGTNTVVFNSDFTATGGTASNAKTLTLGGSSTVDNIINGGIPNNTAGAAVNLAKMGSGTWVLAGANTFTGSTTISNGTLKIKANGVSSTVFVSSNAITFDANTVYAGGVLEFVGQAGVDNIQNLGVLTTTNGANTLKLTPGLGGSASLVFSSAATVGDGASLNILGSSAGSTVTFTGTATGLVPRVFWDGNEFAYSASGVLRAPVYGDGVGGGGSDVGFYTSATDLKSTDTNEITGSFATNSITIDALKISGTNDLTLNAGQTLTIRTGAANTDGFILAAGGTSLITGGTGISAGGTGSISIRVDAETDRLTLESPLTSGTTGGLTKSGAGTLVLAGVNQQTGTVSINEGTVKLSGVGTVAANNVSITMRQGATLDLNGVTSPNSTNSWNSNGTLTNSSSTAVTFTIGGSNGTGTSFGSFNETNGVINITKTGTGAQSWLGTSNYTGVTTIGSTGLVTVDTLADLGQDSGIGKGSVLDNAGSLVFNGSTGGLVYAGSLRNGILTLGATSASTNRLFTITGSGVTLSSTAGNNNAIVWSNTGAIVHGTDANRTITLTGTSQGENTLNPQITDSTGFVTTVTKTGTGMWKLGNTNNTYSGDTTITQGILMATDGQGLSSNSNLIFDGGTLFSQGTLNRNIGTGPGEMQFKAPAANTAQFSGGFLGGESKLTVTWAGTPIWGSTAGFLDTRNGILLNGSQARAQGATGSIALSEVDIAGNFSLGTANGLGAALTGVVTTASSANLTVNSTVGLVVGQTISGTNIPSGAYIVSINSATGITISSNATAAGSALTATVDANTLRPIRVDDNGNTGADYATLSGSISGDVGTGIRKLGSGTLRMTGANTYNGETNINQGTLVVTTLGSSSVVGTSSVGTTANANLDSNAVTLGNTGTGGSSLQYIGAGETSDRKIRLNSTTGSTQIHSDGTGPLILTNVANDMVAGAKTLFLRGTNMQGNMITSQLSNNGGNLGVTVDGGAVWILTNGANDYSGTTTSGAGALGVGHNTALGNSTLLLSNGNIFAYGADRAIANTVNLANNTTQGFLGDYSLTFSSGMVALAGANNFGTNNNIAIGKSLTINGVTANSLTANRSWTVDGSGETIINGDITTSTAFGVVISKIGNGTLVLGGNASNFNQNNASLDIDRGTVRIGADNAIASAAGYGGVTLSPELATIDTAIFDLNGHVQTINALTATTDGTVIIDNTSASSASFTFGANDTVVNFGSGIGSYTIQNSGGGALSIYKAGNTSTTFSAGMTLTHTGITGVTGGSFTIASPLNGTSGFSVAGVGSVLSVTGGITDPTKVTSILVENGGTLRLLDGAGSQFSNLNSLTLGSTGGSMTTLGLNVGDSNTAGDNLNTDLLSLLNTGTLSLFTGNKITLNLTDAGLNPGSVYDLLTFAPGGFTSGVLNVNDWILGATPGGFDSITLTADNDRIYITTGALITGSLYWRGNTNNAWNGANNNWTTDKAGTATGLTIPGQGTDVIFVSDPVGGALVTTLEQNFKINSLTFESSTSTPSSVTIDPGTISTNRIEVAPQNNTDGIKISAGGPAVVNINTAVKLGADQTWTVADLDSILTISGSLLGEADVVKNGAGKIILGAAADPTFNSGTTSVVTINAGSLELTNAGALGATANNNLAAVILNGGAFYYNNATSATIPNSLTLNGGTLSAGGNTQTYSSAIPITADSFINFRDSASSLLTATARSVSLSGVLSGTGKLTLQSNNTLSAGNQESGTLTLTNNGNAGWSGGVLFEGGTIVTTAENALGTGDIVFDPFGRLIIRGTNGQTYNIPNNITFAGGSVGEISADNTSGTLLSDFTVNLNGLVTIGSAAAPGIVRLELADTSSLLNLTGGVVLANDTSISVGNGARIVTISSVISETGGARSLTINDDAGAWAQTNRTLRLTALNTFTGDIILSSGILEFDTVTNAGGAASSLGRGNTLTLGSASLGFIGSTSQSTNRAITTNGSPTLLANGTLGAIMTYNGSITQATNNSLTLGGAGEGIITGGITQPLGAATADITIASGTWTLQDGNVTTSDDLLINGGTLTLKDMVLSVNDDIVLGGSTAVLNLNTTGIWAAVNPAGTSSGLYARGGAIININADDVNGVANANLTDFILLGDGTLAGVGTLNMNSFNITIPRLDVGAIAEGFEGAVIGTGTITATYTGTDYAQGFRFFRGSVAANLAGGSPILKQGLGDFTLSGDNSGLTGSVNAFTRIDHGNLILDYTTYNTIKIPTTRGLDMRGGTLTINGSDVAATAQSVLSTTLVNGGANTITINPGTGQTATLALGAITRAGSAGTLRINLPLADGFVTTTTANNGTHGLLGSSGFATVKDGTGQTWFARNDGSNNIVGLNSIANNNVSTWATGDHVTDETTGYVGSVSDVAINSLRFNAASAGGVNLLPTRVLGIASGGILVTDQVTSGSPGVLGGTLATGVTEIIITQDSSRDFTISSDIRLNNALTKSGNGTLILSGNNVYSGQTQIQGGLVQLVGGNAIGDNSSVTLADDRVSTLQLLASETIGRLAGGSTSSGLDTLATVNIGSYDLKLNNVIGDANYDGKIVGTGTIIKEGPSFQGFRGLSDQFTGDLIVNAGGIQFSVVGRIDVASITMNKGTAMDIANTGTTSSVTRILDTTPIILNSVDGAMTGSGGAPRLGLTVRNDQNNSRVEVIGNLEFNSGSSYLSGDVNATSGNVRAALSAFNFVRSNSATVDVRARNLGTTTTHNVQFKISDASNEAAFISGLVGGTGAAGTATIKIVPWALGETHNNASLAVTNMGNSLVTYVAGLGFRPLDLVSEYATYATAGATNNTRESLSGNLTGLAGRTINSLVLHNNTATTGSFNVTGSGAGQTLSITSGTLLFTLNTAATASSTNGITLSGFDNGITAGGGEYVVFVQNPSSAVDTPSLTATISSTLSSAADITKSGRGDLILTSVNTAGGGAKKTTINEGSLEIADLDNIGGDSGGLVFAGGTLRLGAGFVDDFSTRTITFLQGGGTVNTNGIDLVLANSLGSGIGGFTKTGLGNLTLNAVASYTGDTVLSMGTLTIGANNAIGSGNLTINGGTTLALGGNSVSVGQVTTVGADPQITGVGTIISNKGFVFNHTGNSTVVEATLAGTGGVLKTQANVVLTLSGLNSYTGITEVQNGGLEFNSIGNVAGGASALGNPMNAQDGIIRMGLTTAATALTYTGAGHSTNRGIALQGTTGATTLNANGTGELHYNGEIKGFTPGSKTLILGGTSATLLNNSVDVISDGVAVVAVTKADANTWEMLASNSYSGATGLNNGILRIKAAQNLTGALNFGTANTITTAGTLEVLENAAFGPLVVQTNSSVNTNHLIVATGKTLSVNGNVTVGTGVGALSNTLLDTTGGGSLNVTNLASAAQFRVGGSSASGNVTQADFTGLASMTVSLNTTNGILRINSTTTTNVSNTYSVMKLAPDATITAATLAVGDGGQYNGSAGQINQLLLGTGDTLLNVNTLNIGTGARDMGSFTFQDTDGTLVVRAADGVSAAVFNMSSGTSTTAAALPIGNRNTFDVSGHDADLLFGAVNIGTQNGRTGAMENLFSFDAGTLVMSSLTMGSKTAAGNNANTMNLGGGVVTIGSGSGTAITLASNTSTGAVSSTINITGAAVTVTGNIVRGNNTGAGSATGSINLDGGALDLSGNSIGSATNVIGFTAASGSLSNVAQLNGGGDLVKTTPGVLTLAGVNTYTGNTLVSDGTLVVNNLTGSGTGAGNVTVELFATLAGAGSISGAVTVNNFGSISPGGVDLNGESLLGQLTVGTLTADTGSQLLFQLGGSTLNDPTSISAYQANPGTFVVPSSWTTSYEAETTLHDQLYISDAGSPTVNSLIAISETYLNGFTPGYGDVFQLLDWASLGTNNIIGTPFLGSLPDLSGSGLSWNTDFFSSTGVIFVVPEPSRVLLVFFGLLGLFFRRRR